MAKDSGIIKEFREFIARGNVIDLAVGVVIGAAFTKIVTSLVEGVVMPPISLLDKSKGIPASFADAKAQGIPVIAYGQFINDIIIFLVVAFVVFLIVKKMNRLWSGQSDKSEAPTTKNCPFCVSAIPLKATRCPQCTSEQMA